MRHFKMKIKSSIFCSGQLFEKLQKQQNYLWFMTRQQKVPLKLYYLMIIYKRAYDYKHYKKIVVFHLRTFLVNVRKSTGNCGFGHIY